jgi:acyl-CoA synthetase (AMP-forming)/AMP-acid ligase II
MRIIDFFDQGASLYPDNLAFVEPGQEISYADAAAQTHHIASAIAGHGYHKDTKIGILAPNCNIAFLALLGLMRAQAVWLPINPRNTVDNNIELLDRFNGEVLFYHSNYEQEALKIKAQLPQLKQVICLDQAGEAGECLTDWIQGYQQDFIPEAYQPDDVMALFPTGGTTGKPKGVMISHRNLATMFANFYAHFNYHDDSRHLVVAPMTHSAGILGMAHFARGGTNYMMAAPSPAGVVEAIEQYKITHFFVPPTLLYMMLALPDVKEYDYSSLEHIFIGAAPTSLEKLKEAIAVFGPVMSEAFGQTEAPAAITAKAPWDYLNKDGSINETRLHSIGRPCVFNTVAILDDGGIEVARGQSGEICVKGDLVTPGYFENEAATAEVRQFGWHHTGDIGVMSTDGYVTIVDRKKDMIITGGFNVFPNEIEQVLTTHPAVQECAVIGVPDEKWGESVTGVVQLKPGQSVSEAELIALAKTKLGSVKAPKKIDFVADLPRSPVGKVLKVDIRKQYWDGQARAVN